MFTTEFIAKKATDIESRARSGRLSVTEALSAAARLRRDVKTAEAFPRLDYSTRESRVDVLANLDLALKGIRREALDDAA